MSHIGDAIQPRFEPCRCDACKYGHAPGAGAVLDMRPGVSRRLELSAIRDGRYDDIDAEFDEVQAHYVTGFAAAARNFARAMEPLRQAERVMRRTVAAQEPTVAMEAVR